MVLSVLGGALVGTFLIACWGHGLLTLKRSPGPPGCQSPRLCRRDGDGSRVDRGPWGAGAVIATTAAPSCGLQGCTWSCWCVLVLLIGLAWSGRACRGAGARAAAARGPPSLLSVVLAGEHSEEDPLASTTESSEGSPRSSGSASASNAARATGPASPRRGRRSGRARTSKIRYTPASHSSVAVVAIAAPAPLCLDHTTAIAVPTANAERLATQEGPVTLQSEETVAPAGNQEGANQRAPNTLSTSTQGSNSSRPPSTSTANGAPRPIASDIQAPRFSETS